MNPGLVTTRVVLLLLCGTLPLMVAGSHTIAIAIIIVWNLFILLLILADHRLSPAATLIQVHRIVANKLSIGEANDVVLRVENHSFQQLDVTLLDSPPDAFGASREPLSVTVAPRTRIDVKYRVTPPQRGRYLFGPVTVRFRGRLELIVRQRDIPCAMSVDVYPNIKNVARFELRVRRSHLVETGLKSERRRGNGTDFESLREYVRGDEFRRVDWKATARRNRMISREYQSEVNQSVLVMLDCGRTMGVKLPRGTMLDATVDAALLLVQRVLRSGDNAGLLAFSDRAMRFIPPAKGKRQLHLIMSQLAVVQPERAESDYGVAFRYLMTRRIKRSLLIILTDLTTGEAAERLRKEVPAVLRKHLAVVVSIYHPSLAERVENGPETMDQAWEGLVAREILGRVRSAHRDLEMLGVGTLMLPPEKLCTSLLASYLRLKLRSKL
ncbi:MAG TPA: DUF58 domain-containing protein [Candidatus Ozemobacteraceae bacterium]|nr:DUF58 domain-containing protein [Candidatus Ozemobacteraceae bacterium]